MDEYGNETGEYSYTYSDPKEYRINVSPPDGSLTSESFGGIEVYDAVLITFNKDCPIKENSRIWYDIDLQQPFNYEVVKMAKGINSILYAIAKVKVNG
ncbi:MAG: hypothetical protein RSB90_09340 [Eubacterium sp.]